MSKRYNIGDAVTIKPLNQLLNIMQDMPGFNYEPGESISTMDHHINFNMINHGKITIIGITNGSYDYECSDDFSYSDWMLI
jgi:hypothetical protein